MPCIKNGRAGLVKVKLPEAPEKVIDTGSIISMYIAPENG
jgi:hypothetical protein